jgi:predicted nucleic acid-binding protein
VIAYVDSSVLLRLVLGQPPTLREWPEIESGVASALVEVECLRTLDRIRPVEAIADAEVALRRETILRLLRAMDVVELTAPVLGRAAQPLPTALGTLDALHLATALLWREGTGADLVMATHDGALALAARSFGFRVVGAR